MRTLGLILLALASTTVFGCARGGTGIDGGGPGIDAGRDTGRTDTPAIDAPPLDGGGADVAELDGGGLDGGGIDSGMDAPIDGGGIDAPIDGGRDAGGLDTGVDAPTDAGRDAPDACVPTTTQILVNPNLDLSPLGTGWSQTPCDASYPPITTDAITLGWHTGGSGAWLGGLDDCSDDVYQTVTIPAGTTRLVLRGYYGMATGESGSTVYDISRVELTNTANVAFETALSVSNASSSGAWLPYTYTFANPHAGETVRLRIWSQTDFSSPTSFFYDTMLLEASTCL